MPLPGSLLVPRDDPLLSTEALEKVRTTSRLEEPSPDCGFTAEPGGFISPRSQEETRTPVTSTPKLERGHRLGTPQHTTGILNSTKNPLQADGAQVEHSSHRTPFPAVILSSHSLPVSHIPPTSPVIAKNIRSSVIPDSVPNSRHEQTKEGRCHQGGLLNSNACPRLWHAQSRIVLHKSLARGQGSSLTSGQLILKQAQDDPQTSDFCLRDCRDPVGKSGPSAFRAGKKDGKFSGRDERSVEEIIEEVILKYCYESAPKELPVRDEDSNSCVNILSLLDRTSLHDSDMSFDCDAAAALRVALPEPALKNLELLTDVQVDLQDESYSTQLSCVLQNNAVQQAVEAGKDVSSKEPVLPALPHVPPSFVGKTWSQIMQEDDMKIEALVRDFREGRFRCHFSTESLANCARRRVRRKRRKEKRKSSANTATEAKTAQWTPEFPELLPAGSNTSSSSVISETQQIPELKRPQKRTWRLASRCQVVKVSHGTQTSLVHYPVVKQKIIRRAQNPPDQRANLIWSENEKTPSMKTRLCALKLPESYTKIMSPLQPQTVVYVLSCPETKLGRSRAIEAPKLRRSHHSTDSKESVRYTYKQCSVRYYDPLTNRVLKTPPKSVAGEKAKQPPHVRQLFRSLSLDANMKKQADLQHGCIAPVSFNPLDFHNSAASFMPDPVKEIKKNPGFRADGSSISTEKSECLVCNSSEKPYTHLVLSSLNPHRPQREDNVKVTSVNTKDVNLPFKSLVPDCLERGNSKAAWQRKTGNGRESGFSKKSLGPVLVRRSLVRKNTRKQPPRTTTQQSKGTRKTFPCAQKSHSVPVSRLHTKKTMAGKHLKKEKADAKNPVVTRKPKRTFLNTTAIVGVPEMRQRVATRASLKIKNWEVTGDNGLLCTVK